MTEVSLPDLPTIPPSRKRLALFFDGTWNSPPSHTNVYRLYLMLAEHGADGVPQRAFYDEGVGTKWYYKLAGGAFGFGLGGNVRAGYQWLTQNYNKGDEIYLFGFSRGAFTARALAGVIANCGLLKPEAPMGFWDVFARYKRGTNWQNGGAGVRPIYTLKYHEHHGGPAFSPEEDILLKHTWYERNLVKMVGVWDTVGYLGLPFGRIKDISSSTLRFYNTNLSTVVENSYQALALDEHRKQYWGMLWTHFIPNTPDPTAPGHDDRFIEQRWFAGSHCNVGGGYAEDLVPQRPLAWIQQKAAGCGLGFRRFVQPTSADYGVKPRDSYREFLGGLYRFFFKPYVRWVQSDPMKKQNGTVHTVNERIDASVFERCARDANYRPLSLEEWAKRRHIDLVQIIADPAKWPTFSLGVSKTGIE
jgi:uncharacterized protein (DUF2235 family)